MSGGKLGMEMSGIRNILIHEYFGVDIKTHVAHR